VAGSASLIKRTDWVEPVATLFGSHQTTNVWIWCIPKG
jgi:hypothetical protein